MGRDNTECLRDSTVRPLSRGTVDMVVNSTEDPNNTLNNNSPSTFSPHPENPVEAEPVVSLVWPEHVVVAQLRKCVVTVSSKRRHLFHSPHPIHLRNRITSRATSNPIDHHLSSLLSNL